VVTGAATSSVAAVQKSGATDDRSWQLGRLPLSPTTSTRVPFAVASTSDCTAAFRKPSSSATCYWRAEGNCLCKPKTAAKAIKRYTVKDACEEPAAPCPHDAVMRWTVILDSAQAAEAGASTLATFNEVTKQMSVHSRNRGVSPASMKGDRNVQPWLP
jgi:hypothetical protein